MGKHEREARAPTVEDLLAQKRMLQGLLNNRPTHDDHAHLAAVRAMEASEASAEQKRAMVANCYTMLAVDRYVRAYVAEAQGVGAAMPPTKRMIALYAGSIDACKRAEASATDGSGMAAVLEHLRASMPAALAPPTSCAQPIIAHHSAMALPAAAPVQDVSAQISSVVQQVQGLREGLKGLQLHVQEGMRAELDGLHGLRAELKGLQANVEHSLDVHSTRISTAIRTAQSDRDVRAEMQAHAEASAAAAAAVQLPPIAAPVAEACTTKSAIDEIMGRVQAFEASRRQVKP